MARTSLTPVTSTASGATITAAVAVDAANGNQFTNPTGRAIIEITNGAGSPITVTFVTNGVYTVGSVQYPIADLAVTIGATTTKVCGPFDKTLFNDGTGLVQVDWTLWHDGHRACDRGRIGLAVTTLKVVLKRDKLDRLMADYRRERNRRRSRQRALPADLRFADRAQGHRRVLAVDLRLGTWRGKRLRPAGQCRA
jgi:hypothetical protein